ncbi:uncharacterized protein ARMOST_11669 [Armillaria ostoyae]|uniref:Uncharacterized protein n=1 Tax=Armillaria ostoyae TaxID=47428 RepID=A0A284RHT0_ARMOS|nr:uncharacterized protein ARMOST_11669 [Armillaria ostoyae]
MPNISIAASAKRLVTMREFHNLMGHPSEAVLVTMAKYGSMLGIRVDLGTKVGFCQVCIQAKATQKPFPKISLGNETAKAYGDKVVTDAWGPADTESISGHKYSNTYQDISSREEKVYFMKKKSESYSCYQKYEPWAKVQRSAKDEFKNHLDLAGTACHLTIHDLPQSNGNAEHGNCSHLEGARAMLIKAGLLPYLWAEAVSHKVWLKNRTAHSVLEGNITPHKKVTHQKPNLSQLHEFGCTVWVKKLGQSKLQPQADARCFVSFDEESKGIQVYWPGQRRVSIEQDVYFNNEETLKPEDIKIEGETVTNPNPDATDSSPKPKSQANESEKPKVLPDTPHKCSPSPLTPLPDSPSPAPHERRVQITDDAENLEDPEPLGRGCRSRRKPEGFYNNNRLSKQSVTKHTLIIEDERSTESEAELEAKEEEWFAGLQKSIPEHLKGKQLVYKLLKPLYGSRQGANEWYNKLKGVFVQLGYQVCQSDEAIFYRFDGDKYIIVTTATDDFTIIADSDKSVSLVKKQLSKHFRMTDLSTLHWLLGIGIKRNLTARTITLDQHGYLDVIIKDMGLEDARSVTTPLEPGVDLSYDSPSISKTVLSCPCVSKPSTEWPSIFAELICQLINPTTLFSDNQSAIQLTKDSTFHARTKHIDIQFHFMHQTVILSQADIKCCSTEDMIADIFTKLLA